MTLVLINIYPQVKYTKIYLRDTSLISPFPMLLFGGDIDIQHRERLITLDGWIHFQVRGHRAFSGGSTFSSCSSSNSSSCVPANLTL